MLTRTLFLLFSTLSLAGVAHSGRSRTNAEARAAEHFAAFDFSEPGFLQTVTDADGRVVTVLGAFDAGLDEASSWDAVSIELAMTDFVSRHASQFGMDADQIVVFRTLEVSAIDELTHVATLRQVHSDLPVVDAEVTAVFWSDGSLHSLNGTLHPFVVTPPHELIPEQAFMAALANVPVDITIPDMATDREMRDVVLELLPTTSHGFVTHISPTVTITPVSTQTGEPAWLVEAMNHRVLVDDATSAAVYAHDMRRPATSRSCNVRYHDFWKDGFGRVQIAC